MINKEYTGINVQWPISQDILSEVKTIETRTYPIPPMYLNKEMLMIETPGPKGSFKSRIIAIIKFTDCIVYQTEKEFYNDVKRHKVTKDSTWAWKDKPKYGWKVEVIKKITPPITYSGKKGIVYTKGIQLN